LARLGGFDTDDNVGTDTTTMEQEQLSATQEQAVLGDLQQLVTLWEPLVIEWERVFRELDLEDTRKV